MKRCLDSCNVTDDNGRQAVDVQCELAEDHGGDHRAVGQNETDEWKLTWTLRRRAGDPAGKE